MSQVVTPQGVDDRFVWQEGGREAYRQLMGTYLSPPSWSVRYAKFEGDIAERAEEYRVIVDGSGEVIRVTHSLPESQEGPSLSGEAARQIADNQLRQQFGLQPDQLELVSSKPSQLPNRQDWEFTYQEKTPFPVPDGEARISISIGGDQVTDANRFVFVPEDWQRKERARRSLLDLFEIACSAILVLSVVAGAVGAIVGWSRGRFNVKSFLLFLCLFFLLSLVNLANRWPGIEANFITAQPWSHQVLVVIAGGIIASLFISAALALVIGMIYHWNNIRTRPGGNHSFWKLTVPSGLGIGLFSAGLASTIYVLSPNQSPVWPPVESAGALSPFFSALTSPISGLLSRTTILLLVTAAIQHFSGGWHRSRWRFLPVFLLVGLALSGSNGVETIGSWILMGSALGIYLLLLFHFLLGTHWELIPLAVTALVIMSLCSRMIFNAFPGAVAGSAAAIICVSLVGILWAKGTVVGENADD
jgi:hypothetical protein